MKQIKYIFLSAIICIAGIALVFQGCNNENGLSLSDSANKAVVNTQYEYLNLPKEYQQIGQFHNESLDSVYSELKKTLAYTYKKAKVKGSSQQVSSSLKSIDLVEIAKKGFLNYCNSNKILKDNYENCETSLNNRVKRCSVKGSVDITKSSSNSSPILRAFMDNIHTALKDECQNLDLSGLERKLNKINNKACAKLSKEDVLVIYSATSVAYCSVQYWRKNLVKWASTTATYGVASNKILSFCKKNKRFKSPGTPESDWAKATELPTVYVYPEESYLADLAYADCEGAAEGAGVAAAHALYLAAASAGTAAIPAVGIFVGEVTGGAAWGSFYYFLKN